MPIMSHASAGEASVGSAELAEPAESCSDVCTAIGNMRSLHVLQAWHSAGKARAANSSILQTFTDLQTLQG